jgi:hypothetical protein
VILGITRFIAILVYIYVLAIEVILGMGFFLLLFGANPTSDFTQWVYRSLDRAMSPFRGIFDPIVIGNAPNHVPSVFETSILFAMLMYALLALVIHAIISWLGATMRRHDEERLEQERRATYLEATATLAAGNTAMSTPPPDAPGYPASSSAIPPPPAP